MLEVPRRPGAWVGGLGLGVAIGGLVAVSGAWALALLPAAFLVTRGARLPARGEWTVAAFWVVFCTYGTLFAGLSVPGLFYPFYVLLLFGLVYGLVGPGLRLPPAFLWLQGIFLFLVLRSFVGFPEPVDFEVVVRVLAYLFALLVAAQVRGDFGIAIVRAAAVVTGVILSVWVIVEAAQGGFTYRADVDVDPNVVALFVGLGAVVSGAAVFARATTGRRAITVVGGVLLVGLMGYAQMLVASRGVAIALVIALGILLLRAIAIDARQAWVAVLLVGAVGVGVLLPGGQGLIERFEGERVESAGSRTPIWQATLRDLSQGGSVELWLGHGFDASKAVVQRALGTVSSTHNAYLQVLHEFGIFGLVTFLALHAWALVRSWRTPGTAGWSAVGLVAFLLGVNLTLNAPDGFMYWTALGLAVAVASGPLDDANRRRRAKVPAA